MRILWSVNLIPAEMSKKLNIKSEVLGGWVESMASRLRSFDNIELAIACKCEEGMSFSEKCKEIITDFRPDIVQIEGTEFLHAKAMLFTAKENGIPSVVSMQGILNGQYVYQCGQLQIDDMMFSKSLTEIFAAWILHLRKTKWYKPRMKSEREIIENADYFLGRTTWDRAHTYSINPDAKYYACNRVLREPFYSSQWNINNIEKHSIYVGNSYYALKGFHFVVRALPQLIREYPDLKVYVAGYKPYEENDSRSFIKKGYAAYLKKLIYDLKVENHIEFTGPLNALQVTQKLSKVNAYVLCSAIENSPNTLGEAMTVGTPCVSAYVGGAPDMATDGREALFYRNDDPSLLAWNIKRIFDDNDLALSLSENGRKRAMITHDPDINARQLLSAYEDILNERKK